MPAAYYQSPLGLIAIDECSGKISRIRFEKTRAFRPASEPSGALKKCVRFLDGYFHGRCKKTGARFALAGTSFQKSVWRELGKIPFGRTLSYKELAGRLGKTRAVRAVANAVGANPACVLVPCHRVIASHGRLGGYSAGIGKKKWLLKHEKASYRK